jgi:GT2 family glycosyltransferase
MTTSCELVSIVLVWAQSDLNAARRCVQSILDESGVDALILVDDGAPAGLVADIAGISSRIRLVESGGGKGVAGARNLGLRVALETRARFLAFVDDDAFVHPGALQTLCEVLQTNPGAGAVVPKVSATQDPSRLWRAGCTNWLIGYELTVGIVSRKAARLAGRELPPWLDFSRGAGAEDDGRFDAACDVSFAFGGAMVVRAEAARQTGWFDEAIGPYGGEDIDYGLRMRAAGWVLRYEPAAVFSHPLPPLTRGAEQLFYNQRNLLQVGRRHLPDWLWWGIVVPDFVLLQLPLRVLETLWNRDPRIFRSSLAALGWTARDVVQRGLRPPVRGPSSLD